MCWQVFVNDTNSLKTPITGSLMLTLRKKQFLMASMQHGTELKLYLSKKKKTKEENTTV